MKDFLPKGAQIPMEAEKKKHIPSKRVINNMLEGDKYFKNNNNKAGRIGVGVGGSENVAVLNWEVSTEASLRRRHSSHELVEVREVS